MKSLRLPLLVLLSTCVSAAPLLRNPRPIPVSGSSSTGELATADFNGDGSGDMLFITSAESLEVRLANGTPFNAAKITPIDFAISGSSIGDVDDDGKADVVLSQYDPPVIRVMLGKGDGTFTAGATFATISAAGALAVAELTGDGLPDIAVGGAGAHDSNHEVAVHAGNGAGQFSTAVSSVPGSNYRSLTPADIDGDGDTDLLAGDGNSNRVLLNGGDGRFSDGGGLSSGGVVTGDFNRDGRTDIAIARGESIEIVHGGTSGTATAATYDIGPHETRLTSADVDDDGNTDLLIPSSEASIVTVLHGNADGTFDAPLHFLTGPGTSSVVAADFDRDGRDDLLTRDYTDETRSLSFVRGSASSGFEAYRAFHTGSTLAGRAADMNGDGHPDAVALRVRDHSFADVVVMLNDGTGTLGAPIVTWSGVATSSPAFDIADVNGDGDPDVLVCSGAYDASGPAAATLPGNGDGTFGAPVPVAVSTYGTPFLGRFTADAHLDLLMPGGYRATVYPGKGNGTFGAAIHTGIEASNVVIGDLNGDGRTDFVSGSAGAGAGISDGSGQFTGHVVAAEVAVLALADFDGDGTLDLLAATPTGTQVQFGNGDGTFSSHKVEVTLDPLPAGPVVTADFDGDGKLDFAAGSSIYAGNGDGTFRLRSRFRTNAVRASSAADFDGNGSPDLLIAVGSSPFAAVLLTRTTPDPTQPVSLTLTSDRTTATYGQPVTFTATLTGATVLPAGSVRFDVDGTARALIALDDQRKAAFTTQFATGAREIRATYAGDEYAKEAADSTGVSVAKATPSITATSNPNPSPSGTTVLLYASLSGGGALDAPTGTLTVREGSALVREIALKNDPVYLTNLSLGEHVYTIEYAGDANFEPATATYTHKVVDPVPPMTLSTSPGPAAIVAGQPVEITAGFDGITSITGRVSFFIDDEAVGTVSIVSGAARFTTTFATWGSYRIRAEYRANAPWYGVSRTLDVNVAGAEWGAPLQFNAAASANGALRLSWVPVQGAARYSLWYRTSPGDAWQLLLHVFAPATAATSRMPLDATWLLAVTAADANGVQSPMSSPDVAMPVTWTDPAAGSGTRIKAAHLLELRNAASRLRTLAGLGAFSWSNAIAARGPIRAADITELRTAITQARTILDLSALQFTDSTIRPGITRAKAAHVEELRAGVN